MKRRTYADALADQKLEMADAARLRKFRQHDATLRALRDEWEAACCPRSPLVDFADALLEKRLRDLDGEAEGEPPDEPAFA